MMMRRVRVLRLVALVGAVSAVLALALPFAPAHAAGPLPAVPFHAFYTETYLLPPCTPQVCTYPGQGSGYTTATGAMTETTGLTLVPALSSGCHLAQTTTTFTNAQGNELMASAQGSACPTSANGPLAVRLHFTITGGTGPYRSAGGTGIATGWVYFQNPPIASFVWSGTYMPCTPCAG